MAYEQNLVCFNTFGSEESWSLATYEKHGGYEAWRRALKGELSPEELIDFVEEFGISESDSTFAAEFAWRYRERWSFRMQYFDSEGESTAVLDEDIEWEDLVFLEGTRATAGTGSKNSSASSTVICST